MAKVMNNSIKIPVYMPDIGDKEKSYVNQCLNDGWISSKGSFINKFESAFSKRIEVSHAITVSNGTVALHLALLALGISDGDEVIVPTFTYIAPVNAISYVGAKPIFVDSTLDSWQIDPEDIKKKITSKTKAIIVVHLYGHPCAMDEIIEIANKHNLFLVEDCAESFGSLYRNQHTGSFGHISTFSFFGNKTITTGEGGMVVTNDLTLFERCKRFKGQGLANHREYWHDIIGYNYRMTNICAAIGLAQLERADEFIYKKREISNWYKNSLNGLPITLHEEIGDVFHSYWMNTILVENNHIRDSLREFLSESGIETRPTFFPVHTMPMYSQKYQQHKNAENLGWRGINLPSYPKLSKDDVLYICSLIEEFFSSKIKKYNIKY